MQSERGALEAWYGWIDGDGRALAPAASASEMVERLLSNSSQVPSVGATGQRMQSDLSGLALRSGLVGSSAQYDAMLHEVALELVRRQLLQQAGAEAQLLQMIEAVDDLNSALNLLEERLYEWSLLHDGGHLRGYRLAERLEQDYPESSIAVLARAVQDMRQRRDQLSAAMEMAVPGVAPNLASIAGPLLAARLISRAGGLKRLSQMAASAIQVMGAEKALFKHLKGRAPSPKHGIIYRHPAVVGAPRWARGRAARALSAKLAIAARADYHSGVLLAGLGEDLKRRLDQIMRAARQGPRKDSKKTSGPNG